MDGRTEAALLRRLAGYAARNRTTLVIVTHRPAVLDIVDRIVVLDRGVKLHDGPKAQVLAALAPRPREPQPTQTPAAAGGACMSLPDAVARRARRQAARRPSARHADGGQRRPAGAASPPAPAQPARIGGARRRILRLGVAGDGAGVRRGTGQGRARPQAAGGAEPRGRHRARHRRARRPACEGGGPAAVHRPGRRQARSWPKRARNPRPDCGRRAARRRGEGRAAALPRGDRRAPSRPDRQRDRPAREPPPRARDRPLRAGPSDPPARARGGRDPFEDRQPQGALAIAQREWDIVRPLVASGAAARLEGLRAEGKLVDTKAR